MKQIKAVLGISGVYSEVHAWQCKADLEAGISGSQIDLLIVRRNHVINVCEMKYSEENYTVSEEFSRDQRRKITDFRLKTHSKEAIQSILITTNEVIDNAYANELQAIITAKDLFVN